MLKKFSFFKLEIPKNIEIFYCDTKKFLVFKSCFKTVTLKTKIKLKIFRKNLLITNEFFTKNVNVNFSKKKLDKSKKILRFILFHKIIEVFNNFKAKLKIKGVGYKIFFVKKFKFKIFKLKLGYSHQIFVCSSDVFNIKIKKLEIFVLSFFFQKVTQIAATLRGLKKPDPYKGKGILYEKELIKLKQGKKT